MVVAGKLSGPQFPYLSDGMNDSCLALCPFIQLEKGCGTALGSGCLRVKAELPFGASLLSCLEVPGTLGRVILEAGPSPSHGLRQAGN